MKALVKTGPSEEDLELKLDWPEAAPDPDQVKLRIAAAGICGTDIHILRGTWRCDYPVVIGHEFCGTVVEVGSRVRGFQVGDRVVAANPAKTCGHCRHCLSGNAFMCPERVSAGYMIDGAFAETLCIDAIRCHHLPDHVSFKAAALGEPISVAVHAVIERTSVHAGDFAFVSGPGCVGLLVSQVAKLEGANVILAGTAKDRNRLECARKLGIEHLIDVSQEDPVEAVLRITEGRGADIVYECAGSRPIARGLLEGRAQGRHARSGRHVSRPDRDGLQLDLDERAARDRLLRLRVDFLAANRRAAGRGPHRRRDRWSRTSTRSKTMPTRFARPATERE